MDKIEETSNKQTVGINIDNVRYNCSKISDNYYEVTEKIIQEVGEFFYLLSQVWASNKAINFGAIMEKEINYALNDIKKEYTKMLDKIITSTRNWIQKLELNNSISSYHLTPRESTPMTFKESIDGIVGMDIKKVEEIQNEKLDSIIYKVSEILENLPNHISLYDEQNEQQIAFLGNVEKIKVTVEDIINKIASETKKLIKEEENIIIESKNKSISELNQNKP